MRKTSASGIAAMMRLLAILMAAMLTAGSASAQTDVYASTARSMQDCIMTAGQPYTFWSPYTVIVPDLIPGDVVEVFAEVEVTNPWAFNVQYDHVVTRGAPLDGGTNIAAMSVLTGDNVTPNDHHKAKLFFAADYGQTGEMVYSATISCASTAMTSSENYLVIEGGIIWAIVHRAPR